MNASVWWDNYSGFNDLHETTSVNFDPAAGGLTHGGRRVYYRSIIKQLVAVIDTSFWSLACSLNLDVYLYDFYTTPLYIAETTLAEIIGSQQRGRWIYPGRRGMELAIQDGRIAVPDIHDEPISGFGSGERHAIALARVLKSDLLINDLRPYTAAQQIDISAVSVPEFVLMAFHAKLISKRRALTLLEPMEHTTSDVLIEAVRNRLK